MARHRLAVALLCPPGLASTVDALRRAVGVPEPFEVPAHLTLVPPVNVAGDRRVEVADLLRSAASAVDRFGLSVGPAATFWPDSPTLHLAVTGVPEDLEALGALRRALRTGPFDRPDTWSFVPHVTLAESLRPDLLPAAVDLLAGLAEPWEVADLHLLEQVQRPGDGHRAWEPVGEEPLGGPVLVGRGGPAVVLRSVGMVEPGVAALAGTTAVPPGRGPDGWSPLVVVAEEPGAVGVPVGAAVGRRSAGHAVLDALVVAPGHRGEGRGAHLLAAFLAAAAEAGTPLVTAGPAHPVAAAFLERHGFVAAGGLLVRHVGARDGG